MLTERQEKILGAIVTEYIKTAGPISSGAVFGLGNFHISCPTIRNEMFELADMGFLSQPYTSAGKVPTERAYRFFVDNLMGGGIKKNKKKNRHFLQRQSAKKEAQRISQATKDLVVYLDEDGDIKYIGLKKVLNNPEFESKQAVLSFIEEVEGLNRSAEKIVSNIQRELDVFIGSENPFFENDDYSMLLSSFEGSFISLIGPMRMNYKRNLKLF